MGHSYVEVGSGNPFGLRATWFGQDIGKDILGMSDWPRKQISQPLRETPVSFGHTEKVDEFSWLSDVIWASDIVINGLIYHPYTLSDPENASNRELSYLQVSNALIWNHKIAMVAHALGKPFVFLSNGLALSGDPVDGRGCHVGRMPTGNDLALVYWRAEVDTLKYGGYVLRIPEIFGEGVPNPLTEAMVWDDPTSGDRKLKHRVRIPQQLTALADVRTVSAQIYTTVGEIMTHGSMSHSRLHHGRTKNLGHPVHEVFSWGDAILAAYEKMGVNMAQKELIHSKDEPNMYFKACESYDRSSLIERVERFAMHHG